MSIIRIGFQTQEIKFKTFFNYLIYNKDAEPLYIFEFRLEDFLNDLVDKFPSMKFFHRNFDVFNLVKINLI